MVSVNMSTDHKFDGIYVMKYNIYEFSAEDLDAREKGRNEVAPSLLKNLQHAIVKEIYTKAPKNRGVINNLKPPYTLFVMTR